jgi:hypothetical protein
MKTFLIIIGILISIGILICIYIFGFVRPSAGKKPTPPPHPHSPPLTDAQIRAQMAQNQANRRQAVISAAAARQERYQQYLQYFEANFTRFLAEVKAKIANAVREGREDAARLTCVTIRGKSGSSGWDSIIFSPHPNNDVNLDAEQTHAWLMHIGKRLATPLAEINVVVAFIRNDSNGDNDHSAYTDFYLSTCWGNETNNVEHFGGVRILP